MKLKDIQHKYDLVVSLGAACQSAWQMRLHNLRTFSGPFDWTIFGEIPKMVETINTRFDDYMRLENIIDEGPHGDHHRVSDPHSTCLSVHDFPLDLSVEEAYPDYRKRLEKKINRFYDEIERANSVLFVRLIGDYDGAKMFEENLVDLFGDKVTLLVVQHHLEDEFIDLEWDLEHTCGVIIQHVEEQMDWIGSMPHWDRIFEGIELNSIPADMDQLANMFS